jgi:hypothetical protein
LSSSLSYFAQHIQIPDNVEDIPIESFPILEEKEDSEELLCIPGKVKGHTLDCMIDSGASMNYVVYAVVKELRLDTALRTSPITVDMADGHSQTCTHYCILKVQFASGYSQLIQFSVVDMKFKMVLGKSWLSCTTPRPNVD